MSAEEILRLGALHRAMGTELARARAFSGSASSLSEMNALFGRSHQFLYGKALANRSSPLIDFIGQFPAVVRRTWPFHLLALVLFILGMVYGYLGTQADPDWGMPFLFPGDVRTPFADRTTLLNALLVGREGGFGIGFKTLFASALWMHNTKIALMSFFSGILLGIPTIYLVVSNGLMLGVYNQIYLSHGLGKEWAAWILPHGVTEIGALVLLAGGGLWIGWLLVSPGDRTRLRALREESSGILALALGAFPMLLLAGILESFLRQSSLSDSFRLWFAFASAILWILFFLLVRPSSARALARLQARSLAEKELPLEEVFS